MTAAGLGIDRSRSGLGQVLGFKITKGVPVGHPIIKFTPVAPGWVIKAGNEFYDVLGWTEEGTPVVGTGQSIATLSSIQGEDPYSIMTETTYREEYNH